VDHSSLLWIRFSAFLCSSFMGFWFQKDTHKVLQFVPASKERSLEAKVHIKAFLYNKAILKIHTLE
jgi:hypothetical protein